MPDNAKYILICLFALMPGNTINAQRGIAAKTGVTGRLSPGILNEISGIAISGMYKNVFYVHNDSGDSARFFAIDAAGKLMSTYYFRGRAGNQLGVMDCEDIAVGRGPVKGQSYIYLADIGDNTGLRGSIQVYRFAEPATIKEKRYSIDADVLNLTFPDGPRDAETIMIDPQDRMIYIISKREDSAGIYRCPLNFKKNDRAVLEFCGRLYIPGTGSGKWIVSGDISADGKQIILKSGNDVYYWKRGNGESICKTLQRSAKKQKLFTGDGQQEAISFARDGRGYYVTAEGAGSKIYYYVLD